MGFRTLVLVAAVSAVLATGVGFAAGLAITPKRLTVYSGASAVAVTTCTLSAPAADTHVDETLVGSNFGTAAALHVRSEVLANKRTFIRFDLASCSIPAGALVKTAALRLFLSSAPGSSRTYEVHQVTAAWGETTLTWDSSTTLTFASAATASAATGTTSGVTVEWNVQSDVQAFVNGTANNGWRIRDTAEGALVAVEGRFSSREHTTATQRPSLVIAYYT